MIGSIHVSGKDIKSEVKRGQSGSGLATEPTSPGVAKRFE